MNRAAKRDSQHGSYQNVRRRILLTLTRLMYQNGMQRSQGIYALLRQSGRKSLSSFYGHYINTDHALQDYLFQIRKELRKDIAKAAEHARQKRRQNVASGYALAVTQQDLTAQSVIRLAMHSLWRHQNLAWGLEAQGSNWFLEVLANEIYPYVCHNWPEADETQKRLLFTSLFMGVARGWMWQTHCDGLELKSCARHLTRLTHQFGTVLQQTSVIQYRNGRQEPLRPRGTFVLDPKRTPDALEQWLDELLGDDSTA